MTKGCTLIEPYCPTYPPGIYFLLRDDRIVYVGMTTSILQRIYAHRLQKDFDRVLFTECPEHLLRHVEKALIETLKPELNLTPGKVRGDWPHVAFVLPDIDERISRLVGLDDDLFPIEQRPVTSLGLTKRTLSVLVSNGIESVSELIGKSALHLITMRGFGQSSLDDCMSQLEKNGLSLSPDHAAG